MFVPAGFARAQTLVSTSTVDTYDPINWSIWDTPTGVDAIFYSWTATTTVTVCAVQVPISRYTVDSPEDHQIPISVGIVSGTSTDPTNTTFITNTNFGSAFYSDDYPIAVQPGVDSAIVYFTLVPGGDVLACQEIEEGQTIWIKIRDLDFPTAGGDAGMRFGQNLSFSNGTTRICFRYGGETLARVCNNEGSGAIRILNDTAAEPFNLVFIEPEADWYGFVDEDFGLLGNMFRDVVKYLFTPSYTSVQVYEDSREALETRIPFGLFASSSGTFGGLSDETTTTTGFGFTVSSTAGDPGGYSEEVTIFTPSDIEDRIPAGLLTLIRTIGALAMWTLFFVWIWTLATSHPDQV